MKGTLDLHGEKLGEELKNLPSKDMTAIEQRTFIHKRQLSEICIYNKNVYTNVWIALGFAVTLPVTVTGAE